MQKVQLGSQLVRIVRVKTVNPVVDESIDIMIGALTVTTPHIIGSPRARGIGDLRVGLKYTE